jgi:hypothetical protein
MSVLEDLYHIAAVSLGGGRLLDRYRGVYARSRQRRADICVTSCRVSVLAVWYELNRVYVCCESCTLYRVSRLV